MDTAQKIKTLLIRRSMTQTELAAKMETSKGKPMTNSNFNNKLKDGTFSDSELQQIAVALDATYHKEPPVPQREWFTLNDTGEEI